MILWPEPDFSKRGKRKWGEQEPQHHRVNECAISHSTSLGHDQWSPSRPGWVRSGMSGAQTMGAQRTSCPWSLLSLLDEKVPAFPTTHLLGEAWCQPALTAPVTGSSCLKERGWRPSETLHISERAIWLPAGRQYTNCHTRKPDLMREDFNHSFLSPGVQMAWVPPPPPVRLRHFGNLLPILDEQTSDWRSSWECFFPPPPAPLTF